jgi:hypothetical protein
MRFFIPATAWLTAGYFIPIILATSPKLNRHTCRKAQDAVSLPSFFRRTGTTLSFTEIPCGRRGRIPRPTA